VKLSGMGLQDLTSPSCGNVDLTRSGTVNSDQECEDARMRGCEDARMRGCEGDIPFGKPDLVLTIGYTYVYEHCSPECTINRLYTSNQCVCLLYSLG
jgi:hypothetical protein